MTITRKKTTHARPLWAFFIALFISIFVLPLAGYAADADSVITELQKKYEGIDSLEASFTQEVVSRHMKAEEKYEGRVYLKKPGKMKWLFEKPTKDVIASDGKTMWIYQPDLNQVFETPVGQAATNLAMDFLSGLGNIKKEFKITKFEDKGKTWRLQLVPRETQPNMMRLAVDVDKETGFAVGTTIEDRFANETKITFRDIKTNAPKKDTFFEFTPPKGAKVLKP